MAIFNSYVSLPGRVLGGKIPSTGVGINHICHHSGRTEGLGDAYPARGEEDKTKRPLMSLMWVKQE
jgi:hypothetical protein